MNSTEDIIKTTGTAITADQVRALLQEMPDFFLKHPEILANLKLKQSGTGKAVPLIEHQVKQLRQQNNQMQQQLTEWVDIAKANEILSQKLYDFAASLLAVKTVTATLKIINTKVPALSNAEYVKLYSLSSSLPAAVTQLDKTAIATLTGLLALQQAVYTQLDATQRQHLFQATDTRVQSIAVLPLYADEPVGLLCLGSQDPEQFHPEKGSIFLRNLGRLICSSLMRYASNQEVIR